LSRIEILLWQAAVRGPGSGMPGKAFVPGTTDLWDALSPYEGYIESVEGTDSRIVHASEFSAAKFLRIRQLHHHTAGMSRDDSFYLETGSHSPRS